MPRFRTDDVQPIPASVRAVLDSVVVPLAGPEDGFFAGMLRGWELQQSARMLSRGTIEARLSVVRRFYRYVGEYPWAWRPADLEEWIDHLRSNGVTALGTVRGYQNAVGLFCDFVTDPRYGWSEECFARFGTHPVQVLNEWNTARHVSEFEGDAKVRPLTRAELQALFDYADGQVDRIREAGRKGWLAAYRDATLFKTIYAFGLRRREAAMLDVTDFHRNAKVPQFTDYGILTVRYGKASRGSAPRRRNVLTVFPWFPPMMAAYLQQARPWYEPGQAAALWPTERKGRVSGAYIDARFRDYRDAVGLPEQLHVHCLRHSYVTHLIEDGLDPYFVQQQVGHAWASTTGLYAGVSTDYKNTVLRQALDRLLDSGRLEAGKESP